MRRYVTGAIYQRARFGGTPYYDIARMREIRQVDGLALIFFLGLGDYLFTTPVIEALRIAHPGIPIYAYASTHADHVNSPLVAGMLRHNRHIDAVFTYAGSPRGHWTEYDFRDGLKDIPRNFLILPMIYNTDAEACHRVTSLFETFRLPVPLPVPLPILEPVNLSSPAAVVLAEIRERAAARNARAVVFCHFGTRSSNYLYPYRDDVVRRLAQAGYLAVTLSDNGVDDRLAMPVDIGAISPGDTIEMLRALRQDDRRLYCLSVNSVMWPISAGLEIPNLGLHIFEDWTIHQYVYLNTFVLTQYYYPRLPPGRVFIAPEGTYRVQEARSLMRITRQPGGGDTGRADEAEGWQVQGGPVTVFAPDLVIGCFTKMVGILSGTGRT